MPVTLTIIADDAAALVQEFRTLNAETTGGPINAAIWTLANTPLDTLIDAVRARLRDDGFKLEIIDQRDPNPPASPPEAQPEAAVELEPAPKTRGRPRKANGATAEVVTGPDTSLDEDITSPRKAAKAPSKPLVDVLSELASEPDPAADRQHVMDTLAGFLKDPEAKDRVLGFAATMAKKHGKDRLGDLPVDPFPEIRQAMEKEFPNA